MQLLQAFQQIFTYSRCIRNSCKVLENNVCFWLYLLMCVEILPFYLLFQLGEDEKNEDENKVIHLWYI